MTKAAEQVLQQAMALKPSERIELAERLFESADDASRISTDPDYVAAWDAEIKRRIEQHQRGEAKTYSAEEALRMIEQGSVPDDLDG